jgi:alpha-galactosidase
MIKIVFVGAGSAVFSKHILTDVMLHPALAGAHVALVDIDPERLETVRRMAESLRATLGARVSLSATTRRRAALRGADFVVNAMGVGGVAATRVDLGLPARFGLKQTVGDTLGVGGIFRAARSIPEVLRLCEDIEVLCPRAWLLNYTNPMAMHCLAIQRATRVNVVGLCHGVCNTARFLRAVSAMADIRPAVIARHFRRPWNDAIRVKEWTDWMALGDDPALGYTCAGINHMAFFLRFETAGRDLYPKLRAASESPSLSRLDPVRFELFRRLGLFMTETSNHTAEYVPYFLGREAEIRRLELRVNGYLSVCLELTAAYRQLRRTLAAGRPVIDTPYRLSVEYAARIMNAMVTGDPYVFNGNVHNRGGALISNLPGDACVEVPCVVDRQGIRPLAVGALPPQCAALIGPNISVQDLAVRGILEGSPERIRQAIMMDPNTASQMPLGRMDQLVDAMFKAHAKYLPGNLR